MADEIAEASDEVASAERDAIGVIGADQGARDSVETFRRRRGRARKKAPKDEEGAAAAGKAPAQDGGVLVKADGSSGASRGAGSAIASGFAAMRDVRAASREHADARAYLKDLEATLAEDEEELARRDDVSANYDRIIGEERAEQRDANHVIDDQTARQSKLEQERRSLLDQLEREKASNEQALRPYKELSDTSRGRSEDASRALAEAKRAAKSAESQLNEATTLREQNIASANRALDNSQARLRRVDEELRKLGDDPSASQDALRRLQRERASELAHVNASRSDVQTVTQSSQANVDRAQEKLFNLRNSLDAASREASRAKADYEARRKEYESLLGEAKGREQDIQDDIDQHARDIDEAKAAVEDARRRMAESQEIVDDANDIHSHPDVTEELRASVARQRQAVKDQRVLIEGLASTEKRLRKTTRGVRVAFVAAVAVVAIVVAIVAVWLILG